MPDKTYLCNLPDELLLKIVQTIPPPKPDPKASPHLSWGVQRLPLSDYRSVSLVCRRLNRVATGVMYAHYDHESDYVSSARFIRTIAQNPHLAQHLKSLKEIGPAASEITQKVEPYKRSASSIKCLCAIAKQFNPPYSESLIRNMQRKKTILESFQNGEDTAYGVEAALILALAPNVRTVALNWDSNLAYLRSGVGRSWLVQDRTFCLKMMTPGNRAFPQGHQFEHLRKLKVNMTGMLFGSISGILRLPSLVHLILFKYKKLRDSLDMLDDLCWKCPAKESRIRTIRLDDFDIHHSYIVKLVSSCQHLEAFALSVSDWCDSPLDYSRFIGELQQHHPELEAMSIIHSSDHHNITDSDDVPTQFTPLRGFRNLRYLAAPLELLVSPLTLDPTLYLGNTLPRSLQTFILSKGEALYGSNIEESYDRAFCNKQVESIVDACQHDNFQLQAFGIHYAADFRYSNAPGGYANTSKDLARMTDVHFDFSRFTRDFNYCGVHFDYVIKVHHDRKHEANERLISVRRINGDAIAEEYSYHLHSTYDPAPRYELTNFEQPRFLDTDDEEWKVHRNKIPYELREEV